MRQLMGNRVFGRPRGVCVVELRPVVSQAALIMQRGLAETDHAGRFHREKEISQDHLIVLRPGVFIAEQLREILDHLRRLAEAESR